MTLNNYFTLNSGYPVCLKKFMRCLLLVALGGGGVASHSLQCISLHEPKSAAWVPDQSASNKSVSQTCLFAFFLLLPLLWCSE